MSTTTRHKLTLYIARHAGNSREAIRQLDALCRDYFANQYELEVVELAGDEPIAVPATPTAIRMLPYPIRRQVADLADLNVLAGVAMQPA